MTLTITQGTSRGCDHLRACDLAEHQGPGLQMDQKAACHWSSSSGASEAVSAAEQQGGWQPSSSCPAAQL